MFGHSRKKATEHTVNAIRPLIATFQQFEGLPAYFWRDEFVLGFIGFMISFHGNITSGRKLSQADKGYLLCDVFTALSNMNGQAICRDVARLSTQTHKSKDFERGADYAAICGFYSIGKMAETSLPWIEKAKEMAVAQGDENDHSAILGSLIHLLFYQPLHERFDDDRKDEAVSEQDEVAITAILLGKTLGAKNAREAADITAGHHLTDSEWEKFKEPWERNWLRVKE